MSKVQLSERKTKYISAFPNINRFIRGKKKKKAQRTSQKADKKKSSKRNAI